jgi:hypothetical protein
MANFGKARLHHVHAEVPKPDSTAPQEKLSGAETTAEKSAWATNTVHPTGHGFAKMSPAPDNVIATTATAATANKSYVGDGGFGRKRRFSEVEDCPQSRSRQDRSIEHMG